MKKRFLCLFLLCVVLFCFGCNQSDVPPIGTESTTQAETTTQETEESSEETTGDIEPEIEWIDSFTKGMLGTYLPVGTMKELIARFRNVPLDQLSTFLYMGPTLHEKASASTFFNILKNRHATASIGSEVQFHWTEPDHWNDYAFPIQHIVQLDENHICVVYKVVWDFGNDAVGERYNDAYRGTEFYAYVMFARAFTNITGETREVWTRMNNDSGTLLNNEYVELSQACEVYFASRPLSRSDFAKITVGTSFQKLVDIEPAAHFDRATYFIHVSWKRRAYLLLEDGIMIVDAEGDREKCENAENPNELLKITRILFYPYGSYAVVEGQKLSILEADNLPPLPPE